jgi:hypothetical protein
MTVVVAASAQNVLTDGGFEGLLVGTIGDTGGINLWGNYNDSAGNFTVQSSVVHSGTKAVQMGVVGTGFSILYQNTGSAVSGAQIQNSTWDYSFSLYIPATTTSGGFNWALYPSSSFNENQPGAGATVSFDSYAPDQWVTVSGSFSVGAYSIINDPGNDYRMKVDFLMFPGNNGVFYLDDVSLSPQVVPEPSACALAGMAIATLLALRRKS